MHELSGRTIMVAGGAGFVGSAIVRDLLTKGCAVVCYDNYLHGHPSHVAGLAGPLTVIDGDVRDYASLRTALRDHHVEYIINCIGDTFVPTAYVLPERFFEVNLVGTLHLLKAARALGIKRTVYVSTTEVYGDIDGARANEATPLNPLNTYAVSKVAADRLCYSFFVEHKLPVIIARLFNCYGPRETHPYVIPEIIRQLHRGSSLSLGNIKAARDFTYVHDTARAIIATLESDLPDGAAVNIGSDTAYTVEFLAGRLAQIMGAGALQIIEDPSRVRRRDIGQFRCDNTMLRKYTGWRPTVSMDEGLRLTVAWFLANGGRWNWEHLADRTPAAFSAAPPG